jgi:carboxyl-terminal processing protease
MKSVAAWSVVLGLAVAQQFGSDLPQSPSGQALLETFSLIQQFHVAPATGDQMNRVIEGGITGILDSINDPFNHYYDPQTAAKQAENIEGAYFGIGVQLIAIPDKGIRVVDLEPDGAAEQAGVLAGDLIVAVDGQEVVGQSSAEVGHRLRGPAGSQVQVSLLRNGENLALTIPRQRIEVVHVQSRLVGEGVGYLAIDSFESVTIAQQMSVALAELKSQGAQKLILDLRDNGGGLLDQGCAVADAFLNHGVIVYTKERESTRAVCNASPGTEWDGPLVVLTNAGSASASEIVAGALQDLGRAQVVGEKTFGKGVGQRDFPLVNGGTLRLVTFEWLTPDKTNLQKRGISPDLEVADSRLVEPWFLQGEGAMPGSEVVLSVGDKTYNLLADGNGRFLLRQSQGADGDQILAQAISLLQASARESGSH